MHLLSKDRWTHAQRGSHFLCQPHEPMDVHMLKQAKAFAHSSYNALGEMTAHH